MGDHFVSELLQAFRDRDWAGLQALAAKGVDINGFDDIGLTALMRVAASGEHELAQAIIESGAQLDIRSQTPVDPAVQELALGQRPPAHPKWQEEGKTALLLAAEHGHVEVVELLVTAGADRELDDRQGNTPLLAAANSGHASVVAHLIADAPAELRTALADEVLKAALSGGHAEAAELAIEAGASNKVIHGSGTMTTLYAAATRGQAALVKVLLKAGVDAMAAGARGIPMIAALRQGHDEAVRTLAGHHRVRDHNLEEVSSTLPLHICIKEAPSLVSLRRLLPLGFDIEAMDAELNTPLQLAAARGHVEMIEALVETGAAIDGFGKPRSGNETHAPRDAGRTPLMLAAAAGHPQAVQKLLDLGADAGLRIDCQKLQPESTDPLARRDARPMQRLTDEGCNALMLAAAAGHLEVVRVLLKAGLDLETTDHDGATAILLANNNDHQEVVELLSQAGASVTPLGPAHLLAAVQAGDNDEVQRLLATGVAADVSLEGRRGGRHTALHLAAAAGHPEIAQALVQAGADVNSTISEGHAPFDRTPLHLAAAAGHHEMVRYLVAQGADIEARVRTWDGPGDTPLAMAAEAGHAEVVHVLAEAGARLTGLEDLPRPLTTAAGAGHLEVVNALIGRGAPVDDGDQEALVEAANGGHLEVVDALLAAGADSNQFPADNWSALAAAVANNHEEVVQRLLASGADPNNGQSDTGGLSPLGQAIMNGRLALVQALVDAGADVNYRGSGGKTPLMDAVTSHPTTGDDVSPLLAPLLAKGADLNAQNERGETALHLAIDQGKVGDAQFLIEAESDLSLADQTGRTALSRAIDRGFIDLATLLQTKGAAAGNVDGPLHGDFTPRDEDTVDNRDLPIEDRRGIDLEDNDDTLLLIKAPFETCSRAFQIHTHADVFEQGVIGGVAQLTARCFLSFRLRGHAWTVIRGMHIETSGGNLNADDAKAVSETVGAPVIFFQNSDNASVVGYTYFENGVEQERFFYDPEGGQWDADNIWEDDEWDEDDEASWEVEEEEGWEGPPPLFLSQRRQLDTRQIEDPWEFVDRFLKEMDTFAPSLSLRQTKVGKEYPLNFEGFEDEDFERFDFIAVQ